LFGASFIIASIHILFILYSTYTAPIQSAMGGSTAPRSGGDSICFCPRPNGGVKRRGVSGVRLNDLLALTLITQTTTQHPYPFAYALFQYKASQLPLEYLQPNPKTPNHLCICNLLNKGDDLLNL
jgi:hypothetical protein